MGTFDDEEKEAYYWQPEEPTLKDVLSCPICHKPFKRLDAYTYMYDCNCVSEEFKNKTRISVGGVEKMNEEDAEYENWINSVQYDILVNGKNFG